MALSFSLSSSVTVSNRFPSCCISKLNSKSCNGFNKVLCSSRKDKNPLIGIGLGFVTAMVMGLTALDADATRIEYYATVAEPMCELNYAKSGLGYCDAVEGFGDEAPLGELII
ncbi:peptidyl-prolyl cis-trans isomerase FKBP16-2 chloroplastic-like, partial [Trifolium medium]|nr:peptidyl-prolyl cis-trans isomerase FKBP16-2 chloroplastic-like [Trifolium medium]